MREIVLSSHLVLQFSTGSEKRSH